MSVGAAGPLVVTYPLSERSRAMVAEELDGAAAAIYLADMAPPALLAHEHVQAGSSPLLALRLQGTTHSFDNCGQHTDPLHNAVPLTPAAMASKQRIEGNWSGHLDIDLVAVRDWGASILWTHSLIGHDLSAEFSRLEIGYL